MTTRAELRLALVCYGGVSLAVYMHGVTKELHKLVRASRAFDANDNDPSAANPFDTDSEHVYYDALATLARNGRPLSVAVDIIGGTSAGGINGVVLAKAIALNASQDKLRELWIAEAQITKLLRAPEFLGLHGQALVAVAQKLLHLADSTSMLKSDVMSRLLLGALADMDSNRSTEPPTLIPDGGSLELFVTTTDLFGYKVTVPTGAGGRSQHDRGHAQVMQFSAGAPASGADGFAGRDTYSLAFAARATSAFPAAFAPVSIEKFRGELGDDGPDEDSGDVQQSIFRYDYAENGYDAERSEFVDGGLMDNAPFDLVIDAIARKPAEREVLRRLIYIEPDPQCRLDDDAHADQDRADKHEPGLLDIKAPLTAHPFLADLIKLRDLNARIASIGAISDRQMAEIADTIVAAQQSDATLRSGPIAQQLGDLAAAQALSDQMQRNAQIEIRPTWNTYQRTKAIAVAERIAQAINRVNKMPPQSSTATFCTSVLTEWVRQQHFWEAGDPEDLVNPDNPLAPTASAPADHRNEQTISDFLRPRDTPYRERRLLYILQGINGLYGTDGGPPSSILDALKKVVWGQLADTQAAPEKAIEQLRDEAAFLHPEALRDKRFDVPSDFVEAHRDELATLFARYPERIESLAGDGSSALWEAFSHALDSSQEPHYTWRDRDKSALGLRYLGFPRWDALLYPVISLSQLPQFTPIPVSQFSPIEATALDREGDQPKLYGKQLHHFGAFVKPEYRVNDYLWGRLDAAELIVSMLEKTTTGDDLDLASTLADAFTRIVDGEDLSELPPNERNSTLHERIADVRARSGTGAHTDFDLAAD